MTLISIPRTVRIGAGAGFSGDRIEPAVDLALDGRLDYLIFECLAERTIALAQRARLIDPEGGYDPMLEDRMRAVLAICRAQGVRIITNMGAANPLGAARRIAKIASELGVGGLTVAAVHGDDVMSAVVDSDYPLMGQPGAVASLGANRIISANAYLGAEPILRALKAGADVVVTGRVTDPALFLAPLMYEFGWSTDDFDRLGRGTLVGHLLECAGQITGGYFADPGLKGVPDLARLGFPLAEVDADGGAVICKLPGSGGRIDVRTCKEQLLYEVTDPACYRTADVSADFSEVRFTESGPDRVSVSGGRGAPPPSTLKVSIGYLDGFVGEGQISYAGAGALARGRLALEVVLERLALIGAPVSEMRGELIGVDAVHRGLGRNNRREPQEVRARVIGRAETLKAAQQIGAEVEALYTNGPAGGAGVSKSAEPVVAIASTLIPLALVTPKVELFHA